MASLFNGIEATFAPPSVVAKQRNEIFGLDGSVIPMGDAPAAAVAPPPPAPAPVKTAPASAPITAKEVLAVTDPKEKWGGYADVPLPPRRDV